MAHYTAETFDEDNLVWQSMRFPLQSHPGQLPSSSALSSAPTNYFPKRWVLNKSRHLGGYLTASILQATTHIAIHDTQKKKKFQYRTMNQQGTKNPLGLWTLK